MSIGELYVSCNHPMIVQLMIIRCPAPSSHARACDEDKRTLRAGDNAQPSYITATTSLSHHNPLHVLLLLRLLLYTVTITRLSQ